MFQMRNIKIVFVLFGCLLLIAACTKSDEPAESPQDAAEQPSEVTITFNISVPDSTPADQTIHIAGNLIPRAPWTPDGLELAFDDESGKWTGNLALPVGRTFEYKITRGTWTTVEKTEGGSERSNRVIELTSDETVEVVVEDWADIWAQNPAREPTMTGNITQHDQFQSEFLERDRNIIVYLPPGYDDDPDRRYPVLYMHDGQNIFDAATSFIGTEWQADEHAEQLIADGVIESLIIVGIWNTDQRTTEYTPSIDVQFSMGGQGANYGRFIVEELKPFIDETYRTKSDRENTGIGGSSLGGLISLYLCLEYPEVFSKCAGVSPYIWWNKSEVVKQWETSETDVITSTKWWIDIGTAEGLPRDGLEKSVQDVMKLADRLKAAGLRPSVDFHVMAYEDKRHTEVDWADRFDEILVFLYPAK